MIEIDKIDDFPALVPNKNIRFEAKDELRRSPEMNYECSELEYNDIILEEELVEKYRIRLAPDTKIVMPNKNVLKHRASNRRVIWLSIFTVAAAFALILIIVNKSADKHADYPIITVLPESKPETNPNPNPNPNPNSNPNPATDTSPKPVIRSDKTVKAKANVAVKKVITITNEPASTTVEQDTVPEMPENNGNIPSPENARIEKLERIASLVIPVEVMDNKKTVFVYCSDRHRNNIYEPVDKVAAIVQKISTNVVNINDNIAKKLDDFRVSTFLGRLSLDPGIDKEINEWAKSNPNIPFNVFIDETSENKMKEIYDENGTLVRVIFFTNKSFKYRNNITYHALNNN
ncbi:MAG: hypothetical protein LBD76_06980 [Prevotellaceae bacterium]|jgi:hypothetical protein|nr:hypothetical protein [Prevotellaceae bacterium]